MAIDAATVRRVAHLARIKTPEDRLEPLAAELNGILAWIEQLGEVDVEGVEPMTSNVAQPLRLRDDVVTDGGARSRPCSPMRRKPPTASSWCQRWSSDGFAFKALPPPGRRESTSCLTSPNSP